MRKGDSKFAQRGSAVVLAIALVITALTVTGAFGAAAKAPSSPARPASGAEAGAQTAQIDVNTADAEKLTDLPGIGKAIAQRIVDYRKEHGPFKSVDELLNVRGIGDRSLARIRDRVTVGGKN